MDALFPPVPRNRGSTRPLSLALACLASGLGALPNSAQAADADTQAPGLSESGSNTNVPTQDLAQELRWLQAERVVITSVSKREEDPFTTAAAVSVITGEDIRRSGARSIPDALRIAPGINVAQMDANKWAVTARGFSSRFADKLLVMIDGRSVYTPSFSGVYWDSVDYLFEDIDRIEVIRGPGGTIWGANAVNGVINIITKDSADTTGTFVSGGYGTEDRGFGEFRYGSRLGESGSMRGYLKFHNTDDLGQGFDSWDFLQGGARADWRFGATKISLNADAYHGNEHQQQITARLPAIPLSGPVISTNNETFHVNGESVVARIEHDISDENSLQLQAYFEHVDRTEVLMAGHRNTFDVDFQHRFPIPLRQSVTYGLGYRYLPDHFDNPDPQWINWNPAERHWQLFSGFLQDDIALIEDELQLTLGSKLEHNDFTGFEYQPSARLSFTPDARQTFWAAASRAVQVPGRNLDAINPIVVSSTAALPLTVLGYGNPSVESTELLAYELGHRWQPRENFSIDGAVFYQHYSRIVDGQITVDSVNGTLSTMAINHGSADTYGFEVSSQWRVVEGWRLAAAYSYLKVDFHDTSVSIFSEGTDPQNQVSLRSSFDLPAGVELDLWSRYVDRLPSLGVPGYFDLDVRLGWHATENLEISLVGQNLVAAKRTEFALGGQSAPTLINPVQRAVYAQVSLRF